MNAAKASAAFGGDVEGQGGSQSAGVASFSSSGTLMKSSTSASMNGSSSLTSSATPTKSGYAARPARQQITQAKLDAIRLANDKASQSGLTYNIWYNKYSGGDREDTMSNKIKSETRVDVARDSGWTRADTKGAGGGFVCLFFARGYCPLGNKCDFYHRLPEVKDLPEQGRDVFGREKHGDYRDDMGGVGSLERVNRTLYIGRIVEENDAFSRGGGQSGAANMSQQNWRDVGRNTTSLTREQREKKREKERKMGMSGTEMVLRRHFGEFGEIQRVKVLHTRSCAFVTYTFESSAQFAKEAMSNQSLDHNEVLNVRWATDDPNPGAQKRDHRERQTLGSERMWEKMSEEQRDALRGLHRLEGPVEAEGDVDGAQQEDGTQIKRPRIEEHPSTEMTDEEYEQLLRENEAGWASMGGEPAQNVPAPQLQAAATQAQQSKFIDLATLGDLRGLVNRSQANGKGSVVGHGEGRKAEQLKQATPAPGGASALGGLANYASDSEDEGQE
ncbi:hypothetical protein IE81DRAFT_326734 [Ceraceosorus guamensis]|uniref:Pre-mRNA-splicing factor CWC2 n=1 Tax=Ceraceosorus guamensis TaxID=1522189 RepID=A0A316VPM2_9BASI|nr:hypothetical protein IE81DRAFT_326734 [Ceraceosorus guamensis]PWN39234.1 hypothetical protein IE81DRAFT_326734 [Ceraceosorus guamensis]